MSRTPQLIDLVELAIELGAPADVAGADFALSCCVDALTPLMRHGPLEQRLPCHGELGVMLLEFAFEGSEAAA